MPKNKTTVPASAPDAPPPVPLPDTPAPDVVATDDVTAPEHPDEDMDQPPAENSAPEVVTVAAIPSQPSRELTALFMAVGHRWTNHDYPEAIKQQMQLLHPAAEKRDGIQVTMTTSVEKFAGMGLAIPPTVDVTVSYWVTDNTGGEPWVLLGSARNVALTADESNKDLPAAARGYFGEVLFDGITDLVVDEQHPIKVRVYQSWVVEE